ncbi:MAG TPA: serine/threonine-protein kinase, partial [Gemmata sp.]|nr:serine/threonine-protein kinase [Gemmata sp.]
GELIYEEVCLRRERGQAGCSSEVLRRFPKWADQLRVLLEVRDTLEIDVEPTFPSAGELVGEFQLLNELGRGLRGRVFLARQIPLSDRLVVVKFTPRTGVAEHRTLARLQHTNIVPLYAALDDGSRMLRILCMPYFGGSTLAAALGQLRRIPPTERRTVDLWKAVISGPGNGIDGEGYGESPRWPDPGYIEAVCRIGACLADALQFAHDHQLLHMDVKPSNILLTADGQPMLLDFHLARAPMPAGGSAPATLGGTDPYLSPEHRAALYAVRFGHPLSKAIDARSDLYSLGMVLYEALSGDNPGEDPRPLRECNPWVSLGLSDIVACCLAPCPEDRYASTAALADDLRRHLDDLPLRGVRNRNLAEQWSKWRRRRPHALGVFGTVALLLLTALLLIGYVGHRGRQGERALMEGEEELIRGEYAAARGTFRRGLTVAGDLPLYTKLVAKLNGGLRRAERAEVAGELHTVANGLRGLSIAESAPHDDLAASERSVRRLLGRREQLFELVSPDLPVTIRRQAREDLVDLVILWSHLLVQLAPPMGVDEARREGLQLLGHMEGDLGPTAALCLERAALADTIGLVSEATNARQRAAETQIASAWEHAALGRYYLRRDPTRARIEFERAVELDPHDFWAQLSLGRCALSLGHLDDSVIAFSVCIALEPSNSIGYFHRGLAHAKLKHLDLALKDLDRALALNPANSQGQAIRETLRRLP